MPDTNYEPEKIEAQKRFEALPENLKKEMLADKNVQIIISTCQDYKISEEDSKKVALLAGEVFLGYIKPEEVASELNKYFEVDLQKSNFIEIELKQKIFNGLKTDLDKIYNPLKIEISKEVAETSPAIIKLEKEAAPILNQPLTTNDKQQTPQNRVAIAGQAKTEISTAPKSEPAISEIPFILHTNIEAVKAATPQFPKESPSLNLKVDPSIIQKNPVIKPISVHLETTEPVQGKRFQMPVIAGQKIFSGALTEKVPEKPSAIQSLRVPPKQSGFSEIAASQTPRNDEKVPTTILQATQPKIEIKPSQPLSSPSLKEISEQKTASPLVERKPIIPEPAKVVHYSAFKTDLNSLGTPKKPEPKKDDFINLNTFTKVSGNTVDLRKSTS